LTPAHEKKRGPYGFPVLKKNGVHWEGAGFILKTKAKARATTQEWVWGGGKDFKKKTGNEENISPKEEERKRD